jgi:hypothetical protein
MSDPDSVAKKRIREDEDFIAHTKSKNSLSKFLERHPDGVDNATIAKVLLISEEEVEALYESAIAKIRTGLRIDDDS